MQSPTPGLSQLEVAQEQSASHGEADRGSAHSPAAPRQASFRQTVATKRAKSNMKTPVKLDEHLDLEDTENSLENFEDVEGLKKELMHEMQSTQIDAAE